MENILTLNQSIFGTKIKERRISRRALKASVQELYVPQESDVITYDEGYDIDGGASWQKYKGYDALVEITNMIANVAGWAGLSINLVKGLIGGALTFETGVGAVVAILSAIGLSWSLAFTAINCVTTVMAIVYYNSTGGFKSKTYGFFGFGLTLVKGL